ncbi:MAG: hypothetical protein AAF658_06460 [Myxococcota bacterium]
MKRILSMVIVLAGCGGEQFPPIALGTVPEIGRAATGAVAVQRTRTVSFINRDRAVVEHEERVTVRIVDITRARAQYQTLRFEEGRRGRIVALSARRAAADGTVELREWTKSEEPAVRFSDVTEGDQIDWRVVFESDDPSIVPPLVAVGPEPAARVTLSVRATDDFELVVRAGQASETGAAIPGDDGFWTRSFQRVEAVIDDQFAPHPQRVGPWMLAVAKTGTSGNQIVDYASSWAQVARRVQGRAKSTGKLSDTDQVSLGRGDGKMRLAAVKSTLRPLPHTPLFERPARPFGLLEVGTVTPFEAAKVMEGASAGAFEKTRVALVASTNGALVFDDVPGLYGFETAIVALSVGGEWSFAVPSCANCAFGRVPVDLAGSRAFVADPETPVLLSVPAAAVDTSVARNQVSWKVSRTGTLEGSMILELQGELARRVHDASRALESPETIAQALQHYVLGADGVSLEAVDERGLLRAGESLPFSGRLSTAGSADRVTVAQLAGRALPWFPSVEQPRTLVLPAPLRDESIHTIQLRTRSELLLPRPVRFTSAVGSVSVTFEQSDRLLTVRRVIEIRERRIDRSRFDEVVSLITKAREADQANWTMAL